MEQLTEIGFNRSVSNVMHIDINSCFATIEQQANPLLRNKPIAVAAYDSPRGCILAPSVQAKKYGVKTGMRVKEARLLCPDIFILSPDPDKYRYIHLALKDLFSTYTPKVSPRSIDEFVLDFANTPYLEKDLFCLAKEIKKKMNQEIGDYITVSVGIGPSRFLAKTASNLQKPDGLNEINSDNYSSVYKKLELTDLTGIGRQNAIRLNSVGIYTVLDFLRSDQVKLHNAFKSVLSHLWYLRLRGHEVDEEDWGTKSFGHTYSLPKPLSKKEELSPILTKLVEKMGFRLRQAGYQAKGVHISVLYANHSYWHHSTTVSGYMSSSIDLYKQANKLFLSSPSLPVKNIAVSCFSLSSKSNLQLDLFGVESRSADLSSALDELKEKWGNFVVTSANMANTQEYVPDRIAFRYTP